MRLAAQPYSQSVALMPPADQYPVVPYIAWTGLLSAPESCEIALIGLVTVGASQIMSPDAQIEYTRSPSSPKPPRPPVAVMPGTRLPKPLSDTSAPTPSGLGPTSCRLPDSRRPSAMRPTPRTRS